MTFTRSELVASLADRITAALLQRQRRVPSWAIRDLLEIRLVDCPLDDVDALDHHDQQRLVTSTVDMILHHARQPDDASPAVLQLGSAGQLVTALGLVAHHATINFADSKWTALAAMTNCANALVTIGAAIAHAERTTTTVLLSPTTVAAAHQAITKALTHLDTGDWTTTDTDADDDHLKTMLQSALNHLPAPPTSISTPSDAAGDTTPSARSE